MTMSNKYSAKHDQIKNDHDGVNQTIIEVTKTWTCQKWPFRKWPCQTMTVSKRSMTKWPCRIWTEMTMSNLTRTCQKWPYWSGAAVGHWVRLARAWPPVVVKIGTCFRLLLHMWVGLVCRAVDCGWIAVAQSLLRPSNQGSLRPLWALLATDKGCHFFGTASFPLRRFQLL